MNQATQSVSMKALGKFMNENKMIRYLIYGIILVKITAIYDKIKAIVAINNVYY